MENTNVTAHIIHTPEITNWCAAMAGFTADMVTVEIKKDVKKTFKDKKGRTVKRVYASLDNIVNSTKSVLIKHGLFIVQALAGEYLTTKIIHSSGEYFVFLTPFSPMAGIGTTDLQNVGGGITYLKRYTYTAALNICLDTDNDGFTPDKQPEKQPAAKPKVLPSMLAENIEDAARIFITDGSLQRIEKKYFIPDSMKLDILRLSDKLDANKLPEGTETIEIKSN